MRILVQSIQVVVAEDDDDLEFAAAYAVDEIAYVCGVRPTLGPSSKRGDHLHSLRRSTRRGGR